MRAQKFPVGSVVEGPVTSIQKFGAFVQVAEGVEGMIHVGDISAEKRINHPQDVLKIGQVVKAQVLELDTEKRRLRLGMKQLVPTSLDEYIAEHKEGDVVTGRMTDVSGGRAPRWNWAKGFTPLAGWPRRPLPRKKRNPAEESVDLSSLSPCCRPSGRAARAAAEPRREGRARRTDPQLPHRQAGSGGQENRIGAGVNEAGRRPASLNSNRDRAGRFRRLVPTAGVSAGRRLRLCGRYARESGDQGAEEHMAQKAVLFSACSSQTRGISGLARARETTG